MIRVLAAQLYRADLQTRMPFKYGIATMTHVPHVFLRLTCEIEGRTHAGIAADHLPPKWFTKDPARDPADEIAEMIRVIRQAMRAAESIVAPTVFAFWRELYAQQATWGVASHLPPLLAHFGTSLVERSLLDAFARSRSTPLHRLLQDRALGVELGALYPELAGTSTKDWLPAEPLPKVFARHTVGLGDPLSAADIAPEAKLADGLPQALDDCIRHYGLRHFKVKIDGRAEADQQRLARLASIFAQHAPVDYACSLDGNESFHSIAAFREYWRELTANPALAGFMLHLLFVEQPFHRSVALDPAFGALSRDWHDRPPIIIDESDAELGSLRTALQLGYSGTSHKNCKGIFKGIANACRLQQLRQGQPGSRFMMSGEDLSNIGPVALLQDLAVQALLGITSVERNGHHYFAGVSFWPKEWQAALLNQHGDLYQSSERGWPTLAVREGELALRSVNAAPFGVNFLPDLSGLVQVD
jgi:L-alanine-DL-glutamate epimerase-like enolase superfamily enzyme